MRRAVFLDRDGVINPMVYNADFGVVDSPANPDEFELLPNAGDAVRRINQLGFLAIVVSNQPGIAKGKYSLSLLEATTQKMRQALAHAGARLDGIYYCLHHPAADLPEYRVACDCRKPKPGLLRRAAHEWDVDLTKSYLVGDGVTDIVAAQAVGTISFFVSSRKCYVCDELARQGVRPTYMVESLSDAVRAIEHSEIGNRLYLAEYIPTCGSLAGISAELTSSH